MNLDLTGHPLVVDGGISLGITRETLQKFNKDRGKILRRRARAAINPILALLFVLSSINLSAKKSINTTSKEVSASD